MCTVVTIFSALLFTENSALVISIYRNGSTWEISSEIVYTFSVCVTVSSDGGSGGYVPADTPCAGDPLRYFTIASSGASGVAGGMYGCVRIGVSAECNYTKKYHGGIDIACPINTELHPMKNGLVLDVVDTFEPDEYRKNSLGNYVKVRYISGDGSTTDITYAHLNYVFAVEGTYINENQILGLSGNTGNAADPSVPETHVHIETNQDGTFVDPAGYFGSYISPGGYVYNPCDVK